MAHVARRAVPVVRRCLDDDRYAGGTVALVGDFLIIHGIRAGSLFDDAFDVVVRYVVGFRFLNQIAQLAVGIRVCAAFLDGDGDLLSDLCEDLGALRVGLLFFMHNIFPFAVS